MRACPVCRRTGQIIITRQRDDDWTMVDVSCGACKREVGAVKARPGTWSTVIGEWDEAVAAYEERARFHPCYVCSVELGCFVEHQGQSCAAGESVFSTTCEEYEAAARFFTQETL